MIVALMWCVVLMCGMVCSIASFFVFCSILFIAITSSKAMLATLLENFKILVRIMPKLRSLFISAFLQKI